MKFVLRAFALLMAVAMLFSFVSCQGSEKKESDTAATQPTEETEAPSGNQAVEGYLLSGCAPTDTYGTGLSMVFKLEDGSFLVYDGGNASVADFLIETLKNLAGGDTVNISTWIITHDHDDHYGAIAKIAKEKKTDGITVKEFWTNPMNSEGYGLVESLKLAFPSAAIRRLSYGENIALSGASVKVLCTPEVIPNDPRNDVNTNSLVLMLTVGDDKILLSADANEPAWEFMLRQQAQSSEYSLKCNYLQVPHHGIFQAATAEGYAAADPDVILIPATTYVARTTTTEELAKPTFDLYKSFGIDPPTVTEETDGKTYWFAGEYGPMTKNSVKHFFTSEE